MLAKPRTHAGYRSLVCEVLRVVWWSRWGRFVKNTVTHVSELRFNRRNGTSKEVGASRRLVYPGILAQREHPSRTLSLCPGDEKPHPMQSYQVKHTSHLCITYSQWRHSANIPVTSGCGARCAEGKVPLLYVCTILERLHTQNLCSQGTMTYQWNKWFWTYSQYQEKVLEEEKPSLDAPGSKLQDTTLNSLVSLFPLRLACFQM